MLIGQYMELSVNDLWFKEDLIPLEEYTEEIIKEGNNPFDRPTVVKALDIFV